MTPGRRRAAAFAIGFALAVAVTPAAVADPARAPCRAWAPAERHLVDLRDVPLRDVARLVSCATATNLTLSPPDLGRVRVTVVARRPVDRRGLASLWRALLAQHGLVSERRGAYDVVRPAAP